MTVQDLQTGATYDEPYDKLVLAPGANAVVPKSIRGADQPHVFAVRNVTDIRRLKDYADQVQARNIVVAGGGFVGLEIAENFCHAGKHVTLVEGSSQVMAPFDFDMAQILHKELLDQGMDVYLSSMVTEITPNSVIAKRGDKTVEIPADVVLLSIGVRQETALAQKAGLEIGASNGIKVNHNYQTNDPDIYAVGDAVETFDRLARRYGSFAQASPAQRQARAAADHICGIYNSNNGYIATSCLRVFSQNAACTGMNERAAQQAGIPYDIAYVLPADKVSIMPESHYMAFKLLFEVPTGRVLGAQAVGQGDVVRRIDVIATLITLGGTLEDLKEMELCYAPVYGTAKDVVNMAALVGLNLLNGRLRQVRTSQVRQLVESGAFIVDVREADEYEAGHLNGAVNIPLSQFRQRIQEIPRDIPVYLHCRTSQRSYYGLLPAGGGRLPQRLEHQRFLPGHLPVRVLYRPGGKPHSHCHRLQFQLISASTPFRNPISRPAAFSRSRAADRNPLNRLFFRIRQLCRSSKHGFHDLRIFLELIKSKEAYRLVCLFAFSYCPEKSI